MQNFNHVVSLRKDLEPNVLEMPVVILAFQAFQDRTIVEVVALMLDGLADMFYIIKPSGIRGDVLGKDKCGYSSYQIYF